jgi:hypothetical protein
MHGPGNVLGGLAVVTEDDVVGVDVAMVTTLARRKWKVELWFINYYMDKARRTI